MGREETWNGSIAIEELRGRFKKLEKPLNAFALLAEWRHFVKNGRFAKKRHPEESSFLKKFEQEIHAHILKDDRAKIHGRVLIELTESYLAELREKART